MQKQLADQIYTERGEYHVQAYLKNDDFKLYIDSILDFFNDKKNTSILDAGSGEGLVTELLRERGFNCDAQDISSVAAKQFKNRVKNKHWFKDVGFYLGNIANFNKKYDWILCANTLNWIEDDLSIIEKIKSLAKIGLYVTIPPEGGAQDPLCLHYYSFEQLSRLFPGATIYLEDNLRWVVIWRKND